MKINKDDHETELSARCKRWLRVTKLEGRLPPHVCLKANLGHLEAFFSPLLRKIDFHENGLRFFNSVKAK